MDLQDSRHEIIILDSPLAHPLSSQTEYRIRLRTAREKGKPHNRTQVKVVGRLVEQQNRRSHKQSLGQGNAHPPSIRGCEIEHSSEPTAVAVTLRTCLSFASSSAQNRTQGPAVEHAEVMPEG
eukprot:750370-Hanusia_phi.AAC.4